MTTSRWFSAGPSLIIGHRGASAYSPENTLAAFSLAAELGADGIEFDVQLSADGYPVIIHDSHLERTTNGRGLVSETTLQELQSLDAGEGQGVPSLDALFEMLGERLLYNIEIKDSSWRDRGLEAAVAQRVRSFGLGDRVLISSFNPWSVRRARRHFPVGTPLALIRSPGLLKYGYWLADGEADHPHYSMVSPSYMRWARRRGYQVNVWTVDDPAEARRLAGLKVRGIISNKPDLVRKSL